LRLRQDKMQENIKYMIWSALDFIARIIIGLAIIAVSLSYVPIWASYIIAILFLWWISQPLRGFSWNYKEYKLRKKRKKK